MCTDNETTSMDLTENTENQIEPSEQSSTDSVQEPIDEESTVAQEVVNEPCDESETTLSDDKEDKPELESLSECDETAIEPAQQPQVKPFEVNFVLVNMDEGEEEEEPERPLEGFCLTRSYNETLKHVRYTQRGVVLLFAIFSAISVLACIIQAIAWHTFNAFALAIGLFFGLLSIFIYTGAKKTASDLCNSNTNQTYEYLFFRDKIEYRVLENGEVVNFVKIEAKDMTSIKEHDTFYSFTHKGISYAVRKSAFERNSEAVSLYFKNDKINKASNKAEIRAITNLVCALIELAVMIVIALVYFLTKNLGSEYWYVMLLTLPLPVICIILAVVKKQKDPELNGFHVVLSVILLALVMLLSLSRFDGYSSESYTEEQIEKANELCEIVGIELPISNEYYEESYEALNPETGENVQIEALYVYLTSSQMRQFNEDVQKTNIVWIASLNFELESNFGFLIEEYHDSFFIYNVTEKTYNSAPKTTGVCDYVLVAYDSAATSIDFLQFSK